MSFKFVIEPITAKESVWELLCYQAQICSKVLRQKISDSEDVQFISALKEDAEKTHLLQDLCGTSPLESQSVSINKKHIFGARSAPNIKNCALNNVGEETKNAIRNFIKSFSTELYIDDFYKNVRFSLHLRHAYAIKTCKTQIVLTKLCKTLLGVWKNRRGCEIVNHQTGTISRKQSPATQWNLTDNQTQVCWRTKQSWRKITQRRCFP